MDEHLEHTTRQVNGVRLHVVESGPQGGPPVVLLHGFPEFWYGWRHQIGPLAEAGFRVIAPDQRGYATSEKPEGISAYNLDLLADDVAGLIESSGHARAAVVGHDWGGVVAWWVAIRHPKLVERLAILNAPHPVAFRRCLRSSPRQLLKSWYTFYFQIPRLPEAMFRLANWKRLAQSLRSTSRPGTFTEADLDRYRAAWSEPGAMTSMIHWYRAAMRSQPALPADVRIHAPTLLIWGAKDQFLGQNLIAPSLSYCDQGQLERIEEASHWVQLEEPERVNRRLIAFLREGASR
ncbi:alpha/beta fold hydrolase [Singulisphaera sp. PoT]|uniref:alpha/beta fold hydrolase n=1 Tax=Singulisphaera sp. PoT TaxID=3411797 RepID=UPI003BF55CE6